jgi:circadian clock protein KaiC
VSPSVFEPRPEGAAAAPAPTSAAGGVRHATGVPGLDAVLGGGLQRGALVLLAGPAGSGKTTLAGQIAFNAARVGRRVLLLTALSEPSDKLLSHLRSFDFYDEDAVGDSVRVLSLQQFLPQGLTATTGDVRTLVRQAPADLVVLDGFGSVRGVAQDAREAREFLYALGTTLAVLGATAIITSEAEPRDAGLYPEAAPADVLLGIHYGLSGVRHRRRIEAIKVRGGAPLPGLHSLHIDGSGVTIEPRLETRTATPVSASAPSAGRAGTGLSELDALLDGGFPVGTTTILAGNPGTGKTLLGLCFALAGVAAGEPVVYVSLRESEAELLRATAAYALGPRLRAALAPAGGLTLLRMAPVELDPDVVAGRLLAALDAGRARRLVLDGAAELEAAVSDGGDPRRLRNYLAALSEALRARGVSALILKESARLVAPELDAPADELSVLADNVLLLQQMLLRGRVRRVLTVVKVRYSAHDVHLREFQIVPPAGLRVLAPIESDSGVLEDAARRQDLASGGAERGGTPPKGTER